MFFGKEYTLGREIELICIFNIYLGIMQRPMNQLADGGGLFQDSRRISVISCILNLIISVIGVITLGLIGIFLGTALSRVVEFLLRIKCNFKKLIKLNDRSYISSLVGYTSIFLFQLAIVSIIDLKMQIQNEMLSFVIKAGIGFLVPFVFNVALFHTSENFRYLLSLVRKIFTRHPNHKGYSSF